MQVLFKVASFQALTLLLRHVNPSLRPTSQLREAKAAEKAQFRALHEQKYLPLKKRCAAAEG